MHNVAKPQLPETGIADQAGQLRAVGALTGTDAARESGRGLYPSLSLIIMSSSQ